MAVRGGGHNGPGLGTCDDGLVIDLVGMKGIRVDPVTRTARVEGGCTWGDVDHATHPFGLATPSGFISTTGVGGLTLGGGIGYLSRTLGLTIDNLLSVDMVLADGSFVTANSDEHPDLFWAVRGGGGNFGVVTSFLFQLHPISTVYGGPMLWPLEQMAEVMTFWRDFILNAPEEINGWFALVTVPPAPPFPEQFHLQKMCGSGVVLHWPSWSRLLAALPTDSRNSPTGGGLCRSRFPGRYSSHFSMRFTRRACSGIGRPTSSPI